MSRLSMVACALLAGALAGCAALPVVEVAEVVAPPPPDPVAERLAWQPGPGTTRAEAEAVLGPATWTGPTKEGHLLCRYQIEGAPEGVIRSIVFDRNNVAVEWYR